MFGPIAISNWPDVKLYSVLEDGEIVFIQLWRARIKKNLGRVERHFS
jgi:hypothetical protein